MRGKQQKINKIKELVERLKIWHNQGLSENQIKEQEKSLGVSFPEQYKEFLRMYGWILLGEGFLGTNLGIKETLELRKYFPQKFPRNLISLDNNGSGDYYCLVCGGKDHGKVIFWQHDAPEKYVYPNVPPEKNQNFWIATPDFWTWLLDRLELKKKEEEEEEN